MVPGNNTDSDLSAALDESWRSNAEAWTRAVRDNAIESRRLATDRAIIEAILEHGPRRVLDLGCGEGWLGRALAGHGVEVVGVDASAPLIDQARQSSDGKFEVMTYAELAAEPRRPGSGFQIIAANFALLEPDITALLRGLREALEPTGRLIIQTLHPWTAGPPYKDGWRSEDFHGFAPHGWQPMPWYFRTLAGWLRTLQDAGYALRDLQEPVHPCTGKPLSLLITAAPESAST